MPVLGAAGVSVGYRSRDGVRQVVRGVDLTLQRERILGVAGESGCGKSTLALTLMGFRSPSTVVLGGSVDFADTDLLRADPAQLRRLWGAQIAYLPQDTSTALNPAIRIGRQLAEPPLCTRPMLSSNSGVRSTDDSRLPVASERISE